MRSGIVERIDWTFLSTVLVLYCVRNFGLRFILVDEKLHCSSLRSWFIPVCHAQRLLRKTENSTVRLTAIHSIPGYNRFEILNLPQQSEPRLTDGQFRLIKSFQLIPLPARVNPRTLPSPPNGTKWLQIDDRHYVFSFDECTLDFSR